MKNIKLLNKRFNNPLSCLAIYSPAIGKILDGNLDIILIGDSLGTTLYGMKNTQGVTLKMMKEHGRAVIQNIKKSLTMIDLPFKTYENKIQALRNAKDILNYTKANLIKLEINKNKLKIVEHLSKNNIGVVAHIGVTPQNYKDFKKIKVLGKTKKEQNNLIKLALNAEFYGAKAILLECITENTAKKITSAVSIPTIGIGASKYCNGQILVFDDLINLSLNSYKPKFVKSFIKFNKLVKIAVLNYNNEVKLKKFPSKAYTYK